MKKASSSFLVLFFASLLVSLSSFAQVHNGRDGRIIHEHVGQNLRMYERLRLSDLLRLSLQEQRNLELISLSVEAQSLRNGPSQLTLSQHGRSIISETIRKKKQQVRLQIPASTKIDGLELSTSDEIFLESVIAEVGQIHMPTPWPQPQPQPQPGPERIPQVSPHAFITLQIHRQIRGHAQLPLRKMVKEQLGLSLAGAEIERVVVQGQPLMYGRHASVQVELNNRLVGQAKFLSPAQDRLPLQVNTSEEVRTLQLVVNGDALIETIAIRVGTVRPNRPQGPQFPQAQRIYVQQEVSPRMPLELSRLLGYDSRLIRSITIEARSIRGLNAQLSLLAGYYGEFQGSLMVQQHTVRATLQLHRPMSAHELRIESYQPVLIEALEIEFEHQYSY